MAFLYVTEFASIQGSLSGFGGVPASGPSVADQQIVVGGTSTPCNPFNALTRMVRLESDVVCSVVFQSAAQQSAGTNPTATASLMRISANAPPEYFTVVPGRNLAVISNT